jgi:hypothetical protein
MSKPNVHGLPQHLRRDEGGYFLDYFVQEEGVRVRKRVRLGQIPLPQAKRVWPNTCKPSLKISIWRS